MQWTKPQSPSKALQVMLLLSPKALACWSVLLQWVAMGTSMSSLMCLRLPTSSGRFWKILSNDSLWRRSPCASTRQPSHFNRSDRPATNGFWRSNVTGPVAMSQCLFLLGACSGNARWCHARRLLLVLRESQCFPSNPMWIQGGILQRPKEWRTSASQPAASNGLEGMAFQEHSLMACLADWQQPQTGVLYVFLGYIDRWAVFGVFLFAFTRDHALLGFTASLGNITALFSEAVVDVFGYDHSCAEAVMRKSAAAPHYM